MKRTQQSPPFRLLAFLLFLLPPRVSSFWLPFPFVFKAFVVSLLRFRRQGQYPLSPLPSQVVYLVQEKLTLGQKTCLKTGTCNGLFIWNKLFRMLFRKNFFRKKKLKLPKEVLLGVSPEKLLPIVSPEEGSSGSRNF